MARERFQNVENSWNFPKHPVIGYFVHDRDRAKDEGCGEGNRGNNK